MTVPAVLAFFLAGSFAPLRLAGHEFQESAKPSEATSKLEPAMQLQFGVQGLTPANVSLAKENLTALSTQVYACAVCKVEHPTPGPCESCAQELKPEKKPILKDAVPSANTGSIQVTVAPGRMLRFSELEGALRKSAIQIDAEKFPIAGKAQLVLRGALLENAAPIEKALADAKLFEEVHATYDPASGEIRISVRAGATPPTQAKVAAVIDGVGSKARLADLVFGRSPLKS